MKHVSCSVLAASSLLLACSGATAKPDSGEADAGGDELAFEFNVSGTAAVHPDAVRFLAFDGGTATVEGLTVRVEEPLRVALNDAAGVFSEKHLDSTGAFSAQGISTDLVNLGLAVGVRDDAADGGIGRVVRSATIIYDVALEGGKPKTDLTGMKGWSVPTPFHDALTRTVTAAKLQALTTTQATDLIHAGFILGKVVDAAGAPVAGVTIAPVQTTKVDRFLYPSADYATLGTSTASTGLFLYVHNGGEVDQFRFNVTGKPEYKTRTAGAVKDACLVVTVYPGTRAP